jgi:chemotaxis protein CheY-P-specific phosphatase CheC
MEIQEKQRLDLLNSKIEIEETKVEESKVKKQRELSQKKQLAIIKQKEKEETMRRIQLMEEYHKKKVVDRITEENKRSEDL